MAAARKRSKENLSVKRKINRFFSAQFAAWLTSGGDQLLTLNPESSVRGMRITIVVSIGWSMGDRKARRDIQRSFSVGKPTKVPSVVAGEFLKK